MAAGPDRRLFVSLALPFYHGGGKQNLRALFRTNLRDGVLYLPPRHYQSDHGHQIVLRPWLNDIFLSLPAGDHFLGTDPARQAEAAARFARAHFFLDSAKPLRELVHLFQRYARTKFADDFEGLREFLGHVDPLTTGKLMPLQTFSPAVVARWDRSPVAAAAARSHVGAP